MLTGAPYTTTIASTTFTIPALTDNDNITLATTTLPDTAVANNGTLQLPATTAAVGMDTYTQSASGDLTVPITSATTYGQLATTGTAGIDGRVTVTLPNPSTYTPPVQQQFTIINATGGLSGAFTQVLPPTNVTPSQTYTASNQGTSVILTRTQ